MSAAIAAAAITVGGTYLISRSANKAAGRTAQAATDADTARLGFEREQWEEWQATYGPIEDQLAHYYETLTPTLRITQGLEAFEKERTRSMEDFRQTLAQRGIEYSGIAAQVELEDKLGSAEERARIRAAAPMEVAREKLGFLEVGLGMNPNQGMQLALADQQRTAQNIAVVAGRNAATASGNLITSFGDLAQAGFTYWMNRRNTGNTSANPSTGPVGPTA